MNPSYYYWRMLLIASLLSGIGIAGYFYQAEWLPPTAKESVGPASDSMAKASPAIAKFIVGDQAQKNLQITTNRLVAGSYWKTISIPGMIVDRPGVSDREIVAPGAGIVSRIAHFPGDTVRQGDVLMTLRLASESLQETQSELFKVSQEIELAVARQKRLAAGGMGISQAKLIEVENEIARLKTAATAYRLELLNRGFTPDQIVGITQGKLLNEISILVPEPATLSPTETAKDAPPLSQNSAPEPDQNRPNDTNWAYEVQELRVELGQQVAAGQALCHLSNHRLLAIEGRAFRDETAILERNVERGWPVEIDFQEDPEAEWPRLDQTPRISYLANTIDADSRTFSFLIPLENQSKTILQGEMPRLLWRFRPGQKVLVKLQVEKLQNVFVLPAEAVVFDGPEAYVFTQNANTFERKSVHVLHRDQQQVVIDNNGALATYVKGEQVITLAAIVQVAAAQLNRQAKGGSSEIPKGYHIHADGSLHKNEDEGKQ
ncbi:MAG: MchE protein [Pirellulales bacterium]|nr:MchE protein [Pirellulales bacterium]